MSAAYEFRKIYLDCVEPDAAVSVVYQSWVRLAGVWIARRSVERYGPDGVRSVVDLAPAAVEMWDRACGADEASGWRWCKGPGRRRARRLARSTGGWRSRGARWR